MARTKSPAAPAARHASRGGCCGGAGGFVPPRGGGVVARGRATAALDAMARRYLMTIAMNYGGGPVGVETLAAALSEPRDAIEDIIEPFLIQCGLLTRTPLGRVLTSQPFRHLGLAEPARDPAQFGLFGNGEED